MADNFEYYRTIINTVALYGHDAPVTFSGRLTLRRYLHEVRKNTDVRKTRASMADIIFFECNKVIRTSKNEPTGEKRELVISPFDALGFPYVVIHNRTAAPGSTDNHLRILDSVDPDARGLAVILKEKADGSLVGLDQKEAERIKQILSVLPR